MATNTGELKARLESLLTRFDLSKATDDKRLEAQLAFNEQIRHDLQHLQKQIDLTQSDVDDAPRASASYPTGSPASDLQRSATAVSLSHPHQGSSSYARLASDLPPLLRTGPAITTQLPAYHLFDETSVREYHLHMCSLLEPTQMGSVAEYTTTFWERLHLVLHLNPNPSIKSFVHQYIEGLREDIQDAMRSRSPSSITGASSLARIREDEIAEEAAMAAEKLDDDHRVHVLVPTVIVMDIFPELAAPAECGADHDVVAMIAVALPHRRLSHV